MSSHSDMIKIAEWSDRTRLTPNGKRLERVPPRIDFERNRTYIVTTILEEPYIMLKKPKSGETIDEQDKYIGYCKDLADILAKRLGINCKWVKCARRLCVHLSHHSNRLQFSVYICSLHSYRRCASIGARPTIRCKKFKWSRWLGWHGRRARSTGKISSVIFLLYHVFGIPLKMFQLRTKGHEETTL